MASCRRKAVRAITLLFLFTFSFASLRSEVIPLRVFALTGGAVPPGGTAQVTIFAPAPIPFVYVSFSVDVEPGTFDPVSAVDVFSATGDQTGMYNINGFQVDAFFHSNSGGIGRLPGYPIAQISIPIPAGTPIGTVKQVTLTSNKPWRDIDGNQYAISFNLPNVQVANGLSISSVVPGGGPVPAGTVVHINGQGFTPSTTLQLDGVSWSNLQFFSPQSMTFTLTGAADLTGKLLILADPKVGGSRYYSTLTPSSTSIPSINLNGAKPVFPRFRYAAASYQGNPGLALENDTLDPIGIVLTDSGEHYHFSGPPTSPAKIPLQAGGIWLGSFFSNGLGPAVSVSPSAPVRAVLFNYSFVDQGPLFPLLTTWVRNSQCTPFFRVPTPQPYPTPNVWYVRTGDPPPLPFTCDLLTITTPFNAVAGTADGNPWLTATPIPGTSKYTVSMNPDGLAPGEYVASVTITSDGALVPLARDFFVLDVVSDAVVVADALEIPIDAATPASSTVNVYSGSPSVPVNVTTTASWLTLSATKGSTPLKISIKPSNLPALTPQNNSITASITVQGPSNSISIPVFLYDSRVSSGPPTHRDISFASQAGQIATLSQTVYAPPFSSIEVATESGGNWLQASVVNNPYQSILVQANPTGLDAGTYKGTVLVHTNDSGLVTISVSFYVWAEPTPSPTASLASIQLAAQQGRNYVCSPNQTLTIATGSLQLPLSVSIQADDGLLVIPSASTFATTPFVTDVCGYAQYPGTYHAMISFTAPAGSNHSVVVPLTVTITPADPPIGVPPLITSIVNAASLQPGSIAPGEMITLFGISGTNTSSGMHLGPDGKITTSSFGNRVLFDGTPAPLTYSSGTQFNVIVPYEIAGRAAVNIELETSGIRSPVWSVPVTVSSPAIFTTLNEDGSVNSSENPAAPGSYIQILMTGEGQTVPPGITGEITHSDTKQSVLPVSVEIAGTSAKVLSASTAPGAPAGLFQIKVQLPSGLPTSAAQIQVRIGSTLSPTGSFVWIK